MLSRRARISSQVRNLTCASRARACLVQAQIVNRKSLPACNQGFRDRAENRSGAGHDIIALAKFSEADQSICGKPASPGERHIFHPGFIRNWSPNLGLTVYRRRAAIYKTYRAMIVFNHVEVQQTRLRQKSVPPRAQRRHSA